MQYTAFGLSMQVQFLRKTYNFHNALIVNRLIQKERVKFIILFQEDLIWHFVYIIWQHFDICVEATVQFDYASMKVQAVFSNYG